MRNLDSVKMNSFYYRAMTVVNSGLTYVRNNCPTHAAGDAASRPCIAARLGSSVAYWAKHEKIAGCRKQEARSKMQDASEN